jgi:hypothetical protein
MRHDRQLNDAFSVIERYAPDIYARMEAADWLATADFGRVADRLHLEPEVAFETGLQYAAMGYGATVNAPPSTWLNMPAITAWSEDHGMGPEWFTADVLVHEFTHTSQGNVPDTTEFERAAFTAGSQFARLLPPRMARPIVALSDSRLTETYGEDVS